MTKKPARRARASTLCRHFEGTELVGSARAGLECLEAEHKTVILGGASIGCGVALDRCRQAAEPEASRWDYVFTARDSDDAIGIEVHHAAATEVSVMIAKRDWARHLLALQCPSLRVLNWVWVASPPKTELLFLPQHPAAKRLAEAGISFPKKRVDL